MARWAWCWPVCFFYKDQLKSSQKASVVLTIGELVDLYFKRKIVERGEPPKTETESRQRFQKHFSVHWSKTPSEIAELDLLRIRHSILKSGGKMGHSLLALGFLSNTHQICGSSKTFSCLGISDPCSQSLRTQESRDRALNKGGIEKISGSSWSTAPSA